MSDWLPPLFKVDPWRISTYDKLYRIFCLDIRDATLLYRGNRVWFFPELEDGREVLFWHLTTRKPPRRNIPRRMQRFANNGTLRQNDDSDRLPDPRRCERLPWVNPLVNQSHLPQVLSWNYEEGDGVIKTYVWIKDRDFVVIMKCYPDGGRRLITSFYIDKEWTRNDMQRKYENRIQ